MWLLNNLTAYEFDNKPDDDDQENVINYLNEYFDAYQKIGEVQEDNLDDIFQNKKKNLKKKDAKRQADAYRRHNPGGVLDLNNDLTQLPLDDSDISRIVDRTLNQIKRDGATPFKSVQRWRSSNFEKNNLKHEIRRNVEEVLMWNSEKRAQSQQEIQRLTQRLTNMLLSQHQQQPSSTSFYHSNKNKISEQTLLGQLIDRSDYYPSNVQLQPQACHATEGGIEKKGKNQSKFWNKLERQVSKIESEKDFKLNNYYDTPQRIGTIYEEQAGKDPFSPYSKKSQLDTIYSGSRMIHPNNTEQNYENLQGQIGMASPSLGISSATSPSNIRNLAYSNAKTNSVISGNDIKLRHDPVRQIINERAEIDMNRRQYQKIKKPTNLQNIQTSTPQPTSTKIQRLDTIVTQPSTTKRGQVPIKPRPFHDRTSSIISNTRDTQLISSKHSHTTSTRVQLNKEQLNESVVQLVDAKKLIRNGCRAARFAIADLFKFFTREKQPSSQKRSGSCGSKFSKGERPKSAVGAVAKNKRVQIAKKYFDINQSIQTPSSARRYSNNYFYKKQNNQRNNNIKGQQTKSKHRVLPSQVTQQDDYDSIPQGGFRRTSCPPKARDYNQQQVMRGHTQQLNNPRIYEQQQKRPYKPNQIRPLSISQINSPFSLDSLKQQQKIPQIQNRVNKRRPDQVQTITYQERSDQKGEYTIPRIEYMRQLSTSSPNNHSVCQQQQMYHHHHYYFQQQKSNDLSHHQSVTRNRTPGKLMQDVQKNQQQQLEQKYKRRSSGSVHSSLGYSSIQRGVSNTNSATAPQTARFANTCNNESLDQNNIISPRVGDLQNNNRGRNNFQFCLPNQNNNVINMNAQLYSPTSSIQQQEEYKANQIQIIDDEQEEVKKQISYKSSSIIPPPSRSSGNQVLRTGTPNRNVIHHKRSTASDNNMDPFIIGQGTDIRGSLDKKQIHDSADTSHNNKNKNSKSQIPLSRTIDLESLQEGSGFPTPTISAKLAQKVNESRERSSKKSLLKNPGSDDLTGKFSDKFLMGAINDYRGGVASLAAKNQGRGLAGILSRGKSHQANNK